MNPPSNFRSLNLAEFEKMSSDLIVTIAKGQANDVVNLKVNYLNSLVSEYITIPIKDINTLASKETVIKISLAS
jgi:hypothetical protein